MWQGRQYEMYQTSNTICQINSSTILNHNRYQKKFDWQPSLSRPSSSPAIGYCPSLSPDRTADPNSNIVLKAAILQKMLSIKSKFSIDKIKSDNFMCVSDSVQECVRFDHASNEL
jgi:hypothetical protein